MRWHRFDAFVPQENRKQTLSIFAKEIDVLFNVTVGHKEKAASPAPQLFPGYQLTVVVTLFLSPLQQENAKLY